MHRFPSLRTLAVIAILGVGAAVVARVRRPGAALVATALGLFVFVGFLVSPTGIDNLTGGSGAVVAIVQAVQVLGVVAAAAFGVLAFRSERAARTGSTQAGATA